MRKLASVRQVLNIRPIPDADRIEVATVDGWDVVVAKNEFKVGDLCVYFEIDSWVPTAVAPFLTKPDRPARIYKGVSGERLKTVKLRGQLSQGLIISLSNIDQPRKVSLGEDLTEWLGVLLYDLEGDAAARGVGGQTKGLFPVALFPKTDQERIQNCFNKRPREDEYEVTLKLDGSSCTIFKYKGQLRVCSRNLELKLNNRLTWFQRVKQWFGYKVEQPQPLNHFVKMALQVEEQLKGVDNIAFQGELMGPGIQGNRESLDRNEWFVYDVIDLKTRRYYNSTERLELVHRLALQHVPVLGLWSYPSSVETVLSLVDNMKSMKHPVAEGVVYKSTDDPSQTFKVISNRYLLKQSE